MPIGVAGRHADRFAPEGLEQVRSRAFSPCDHVLGVAFRQLLANDEPLGLEELASSTGLRPGDVEAELASLAEEGRVRCDAAARVVGILGLSLEPTQHEITVGDLRRWTWCAYDAVGILAAFGQNGLIRSSSPVDASVLEIRVVAGEPLRTDVVLFIPDDRGDSVVDDWCPLVNFFPSAEAAAKWSDQHGVKGDAVPIADAARSGADHWGRYVHAPPR